MTSEIAEELVIDHKWEYAIRRIRELCDDCETTDQGTVQYIFADGSWIELDEHTHAIVWIGF